MDDEWQGNVEVFPQIFQKFSPEKRKTKNKKNAFIFPFYCNEIVKEDDETLTYFTGKAI